MTFIPSKLLSSMQKIRFDEIEAKQQYFQEDLKNEENEEDFSKKYNEFRENFIDIHGVRTKIRQQGQQKQQQQDFIDSQIKLIQTLYPGVIAEDLTNQILAIITLVYMEDLIEKSKVQSAKEGCKQIKGEHVKEIVRQLELKNQNKNNRQFSSFFQ